MVAKPEVIPPNDDLKSAAKVHVNGQSGNNSPVCIDHEASKAKKAA
jgi:hypothetical protein